MGGTNTSQTVHTNQTIACVMSEGKEQGNRVQISAKDDAPSLGFYVTLARKLLATNDEVELSGIGTAMNSVVSVAEIMSSSCVAEKTRVRTSTHESEEGRGNKRRLQIWIKRGPEYTVPETGKKEED